MTFFKKTSSSPLSETRFDVIIKKKIQGRPDLERFRAAPSNRRATPALPVAVAPKRQKRRRFPVETTENTPRNKN
jgi:hypothetical protein